MPSSTIRVRAALGETPLEGLERFRTATPAQRTADHPPADPQEPARVPAALSEAGVRKTIRFRSPSTPA